MLELNNIHKQNGISINEIGFKFNKKKTLSLLQFNFNIVYF